MMSDLVIVGKFVNKLLVSSEELEEGIDEIAEDVALVSFGFKMLYKMRLRLLAKYIRSGKRRGAIEVFQRSKKEQVALLALMDKAIRSESEIEIFIIAKCWENLILNGYMDYPHQTLMKAVNILVKDDYVLLLSLMSNQGSIKMVKRDDSLEDKERLVIKEHASLDNDVTSALAKLDSFGLIKMDDYASQDFYDRAVGIVKQEQDSNSSDLEIDGAQDYIIFPAFKHLLAYMREYNQFKENNEDSF